MKTKEVASALKKVFSNWEYSLLAIIIAVVFYSLDIFLSNLREFMITGSQYGFFAMAKKLPSLMVSYPVFFSEKFFIALIVLSFLFGMLFSLITYKTKMIKSASGKIGIFVTLGIFLGVLAPGCPACGIGLLSLLGFGSAVIAFLPFKGFGLLIISIGLMSFSVYKISKDINRGIVCEIKIPG